MTKKAQLSMETIMIYGAVLLVVTLAIGALMYFGVLDLGALLPDKCNTGSKITCEQFVVENVAQGVQLEFVNRVGKNIQNVVVTITGLEDWTGVDGSQNLGATIYNNGQTIIVNTPGVALTNREGRYKARIDIAYQVVGSALTQHATGEINAKIAQ